MEGTVRLISEYGIMIVCSAVLILIVVFLFKDFQKRNEEILSHILKHYDETKAHHPSPRETEVLDIVNDKIKEIIVGTHSELNPDRVFVYLYHNGGVSTSGLSFQKMSCISEIVGPGVLPVSDSAQNLHKGPYSEICKSLREKGEYFVRDISEVESIDPVLYCRCTLRHSKSIYLKAIRDNGNYVIGFLGIDYSTVCPDEHRIIKIRSVLSRDAYKLSGLVTLRKGDLNENS